MSPCASTEILARIAAGDLQAHALVRAHLVGCPSCQRHLDALCADAPRESLGSGPTYIPAADWNDEPTAPSGRPLDVEAPEDRHLRAAGTRVGRYRLLDVVGYGGAGVVYAAWDPQLDRKIALKLLTLPRAFQQAEPEARARLLREAQAMARLHHPNVVTVHDVGDFEGTVFIAMEFVGGGTLRTWLQTQRPTDEVLAVLLAAGRGLCAAHRAGLVHRDLKPENVLLTPDGEVKVSDFGLARSAGARGTVAPEGTPVAQQREGHDSPLHSPLTVAGAVLGTPGYMPPEQVRGAVTGPEGDQFSFCVSAWEALFGERPFAGKTLGDLTLASLRGEIRPPPAAARVPGHVHRALLRGLRGNPEERYPSMEALLADLSPRKSFTRRHWLALARSTTVIAASVLLGAFYVSWKNGRCDGLTDGLAGIWDDARKAELRASFERTGVPYAGSTFQTAASLTDAWTERWKAHRVEACEATLLRDEQPLETMRLRQGCLEQQRGYLEALGRVWSGADRRAVEEAAAAARSLPDPAACGAARVAAGLIEESERHPDLVQALTHSAALLAAGAYADSLATAEAALSEAKAVEANRLTAQALFLAGQAQFKAGDRALAEATFQKAARAGVASGDDALFAAALVQRVRLASLAGRIDEARELERDAQAAVQRLSGREDLQADLLATRGERLRAEGRLQDALATFRDALELRRRVDGPRSAAVADLLVRVAVTKTRQGAFAEAQASLEEALPLVKQAFGADHPEVARVHVDLGNTHFRQGQYESAAAHHRQALALYEAAVGTEHLVLGAPLTNLGNVLRTMGRTDEALALHERALALAERTQGETARLSAYLGNLAESLLAQGRAKDAKVHADRAVALRAKLLPAGHPDNASSLTVQGEVLATLGRHAEAQAALGRALAIREGALGAEHYLLAETLERLGRAHLLARRPKDAVSALERALKIRQAQGVDPTQAGHTARLLEEARLQVQ